MAPFFIFSDPGTILTGNPLLQPSYSDALRIAHNVKTVALSFEYTYTDNPISFIQPSVDPETNIQVNAPKNLVSSNNIALIASFPVEITKWWSIRANLTAKWARVKDEIDGNIETFDQPGWNTNGSSVFTLPKNFTIEISGRYNSPEIDGAIKWQSNSSIDFGATKKFENGSTIRFAITDIFKGNNWIGTVDDPTVDFKYEGAFFFTERVFRLSYSHQFGDKSLKKARERETGSAEEQARTN